MAKNTVLKGTTSRSEYIFVQDSSSTTGAGLSGLVYNSPALAAYYCRERGTATVINLATLAAPDSAWSSGGFKEVSAVNLPGVYRVDIPNAVFATGSDKAIVMLKGATNMAPVVMEYELISVNPQDPVRFGLTALPNVAQGSAGALPTGDAGGNAKIQNSFKKNTSCLVPFLVTDSTTHAPKTGQAASISVTRSIDGAAFGAGAIGAVSELGATGVYRCTFGAADMNGAVIVMRATCANADDVVITMFTTP